MPVSFDNLQVGKRYTRPELAKLWGYRSYEAISKGVVTPSGAGVIILFVTHLKQEHLTAYHDFISDDYLYWEGEQKHKTDERVARAHENGEDIHLFYREIHHTPFQYRGKVQICRFVQHVDRPSEFVFQLLHDLGAQDDMETHWHELAPLGETERLELRKARVGQGRFRDSLLTLWKGCAVTGVNEQPLLRASHIKPWRDSTNEERLDPFNGLLLLPQYDHLFDKGFITFDQDGRIALSPALEFIPLPLLGVDALGKLRMLEPEHRNFLEHHREAVFIGQTTPD